MAGIDQLIINSAYREPTHHWKYDLNGQTFQREPGRRPAGYFVAGQGSNGQHLQQQQPDILSLVFYL